MLKYGFSATGLDLHHYAAAVIGNLLAQPVGDGLNLLDIDQRRAQLVQERTASGIAHHRPHVADDLDSAPGVCASPARHSIVTGFACEYLFRRFDVGLPLAVSQ